MVTNFPPTSHVIHSVSLQRNEPRQIKLCCILLTIPHFMCTYGVDMWPRTHTHAATVHESLFYSVSRYDSSPSWLQQWHCYSMSDQSVDLKKEKKKHTPLLRHPLRPNQPCGSVLIYPEPSYSLSAAACEVRHTFEECTTWIFTEICKTHSRIRFKFALVLLL